MVQLYHGTTRKFKEFDSIHLGGATKSRSARFGFWFTDDIETAKSYAREENNAKVNELIRAGKVEEASRLEDKIFNNTDTKYLKTISLSYNNPLTIDADGRQYNDYSEEIIDAIKQAVDNKNDVLIVKNLSDHADYSEYRPSTHYLVLGNTIIEQSKPDLKFEIGGVYQGTPHDFDKYSTEFIGTGEGNQVFGWGLYFTDQKDIADYYKNAGLKEEDFVKFNGKKLSEYNLHEDNKEQIYGIIDTIQKEDKVVPTTELIIDRLILEYDEENYPEFKELVELSKKTYNFIKDKKLTLSGNIYSVTLFKGRNNNLLEWEKKPTKLHLDLVKNQLENENIIVERDLGIGKNNRFKGEALYKILNEQSTSYTEGTKNQNLYTELSSFLGSDKETSLFLLRSGIDGIKYKAGTLSGMEDKEGYNYVIFDANEATILGKERYADGGLIAPNGKKSNLSPEQYKLVRTPEFKAWFGDWENDAENSSQVIDSNGEPLLVWHGSKSNENFNVFKQSSRFEFIYFAKTKEYAWLHFTKDIIDKPFQLRPFFLNIRNLLNAEEYGFEKVDFSELKSFFYGIHELSKDIQLNPKSQYKFWEVLRFSNDIYHSLKNQDYDGISFYENFYDNTTWNDTDDYSLSYVVMNPNQIKLADGSNTTFDGSNLDIRYADGGEVAKNKETYKKWKSLVNMSKSELEKFYNSQEGKDAGLSSQEASEQGISSGRESARWIMKMKDTNVSDWTPSMWRWAKKQISFISRMSGNKGSLYDDKGDKTRKHTSLLIWGHNPKKNKFDLGGLLAPQKMPTFIAPNGNRSNLLHIKEIGKDDRWVYLYDIVRTREFKEWFGDWEEAYKTKDYEGVSKIIDENGEPSICYHTTNDDFFEFNENFIGGKTDKGYYGRGFYFTEGSADSHYGQREIPCFLNIRNPYLKQSSYKTYELDTEDLKSKGYDGVIVFSGDIKNIDLSKGLGYDSNRVDEIVAYNPEDIKLADATNTAFDKYDSDIRYKNGGQAFNDKELLSKWKRGESIGFTATSHLKAKGLIPRADGTKRKSEKYIFDSGNAMNVEVKLVKGNDLSDKVLDLVLNTDELGAVGQPRLALLENGNVIGGIFLEPPNSYSLNGKYVVETYWEYKFDIIIERSKRKKGYSKILLDAMIKDFVDNFPDADQIRGEVINKKLQKSLEKYYGFSCDSRNEENITYCYLSKDDAVKFKYADGGQTPYVSDDFQIGYDGAYENLLAPNGQPSNLTPEQYRLVRTPAFKNWFGDWERLADAKIKDSAIDEITLGSISKEVSKVVDENGEPLVVYHGAKIDFNEFIGGKLGVRKDNSQGFYFTPFKNIAENFAKNGFVKEVFLKIFNLKIAKSYLEIGTINKDYVTDAIDKGYDGAYFMPNKESLKNGYYSYYNEEYVAFYPTQIKLADGTNTTFDSNNPDIRYVDGGNIPKFDIKSRAGEEDRTTISLKGIGEVILVETFPEYEFTEDVDEYTLNDLGLSEGDMIGKIEHIEIKDEYKGKGYAKLLIKKAIELAKEKGLMPLYLNASPMGSKRYGLSLEDLTGFYESFGFKVFLNQGNNNLMILKEDVKFKNGGKVKVEPMSFPTFVDLDNSFPIDKGYRWADWQEINTPTEMNKVFKHYNIPLKAKKNLGKGLFGYAFLTDKDTVVKITNNSNEAFASFVIMQKGNLLTTQAKVFKMYKITNGSRSLYIIEKEYIPQVLENIKSPDLAYKSVLEYAKKVSNIRFADGNPYSDKDLYEKAREYYQSNYGSEDDEMIAIIYKILKFYIDIEKDERAVNLDFDDIHTGNMGFKDDKLLCFDCAMTGDTELKSGGLVN